MIGVREVTFYLLSSKNLARPKKDLKPVFDVIESYLRTLLIHEESSNGDSGRCYKIIGNVSSATEEIKTLCAKLESITEDKSKCQFSIHIAIGHDGKNSMTDACRDILFAIRNDVISDQNVTKEMFHQILGKNECFAPSLVIRSAGKKRYSQFLLWQVADSYLYIISEKWPAFSKWNLIKAIVYYRLINTFAC